MSVYIKAVPTPAACLSYKNVFRMKAVHLESGIFPAFAMGHLLVSFLAVHTHSTSENTLDYLVESKWYVLKDINFSNAIRKVKNKFRSIAVEHENE